VEQDQSVRRNEPLKSGHRPFALLLAAHGERCADAENAGVAWLARRLGAEGVATEVAVGFIKGTPSVGDAIRALAPRDVVVYPLFLADGYFARIALPRLIDKAKHDDSARIIKVLPPLGLELALIDVIADEVGVAAHARRISPADMAVVLLAHGSTKDRASRIAAEQLAERLRERRRFRDLRFALLEEPPSLAEAVADVRGPVVVVGLFAGEGMHGASDAKRLVAKLAREDVILIGPVGTFAGIVEVIAAAVVRHTPALS
jgi:sirohydrochlorin ferrochelatase